MKVLELKQIQREEGCIYFRRKFSAIAVVDILTKPTDISLIFIMETGPLGDKKIEVSDVKGDFNYPLLPVVKTLREYIRVADSQGQLPL